MTKNKKVLSKNILFTLFFYLLTINFFIVNNLVIHTQAACGPAVGIPCNPLDGTVSNLSDAIIVVTLYLLSLIGLVSLLFIVFAGIKYMSSAGNEEQIRSAKNTLYSAVFGLTVALMAYGILSVINDILNG